MALPSNKLLLNLSGGMNTQTNPLLIKDEECELLLNFDLDVTGSLKKRNGYIPYADQPVAGVNINGLFLAITTSSIGVPLMVANNSGGTNGVIYYTLDGVSWTAAKTDDTASRKTRFCTFINRVFRTNGADVVASAGAVNTWGTTSCPATITPQFCAVFQSRMYVARGSSGFGTTSSRVWFSSLPDSAGTAITWDTTNDRFDVNPNDGDAITALENNGNRLLIFKNRSMYRWTYGQVDPDRIIGVGTSAQESVRTNFDLGVTFFANPRGIYAYTDNRPKLISRKIQPYIDAVSDWTNVAAEVDRDHYYLSVGNITVGGRTYTNAIFVYNIPLDAWSIFTTFNRAQIFALMGTDFTSTMPLTPFFGSTNGRVYQYGSGTADKSDGSTLNNIVTEFRSKEYILSYPYTSQLSWLDVFSDPSVETTVFYDLDRADDFKEIGQLKYRFMPLRIPQPRSCHSIRLKLGDNSQNAMTILGFNAQFNVEDKRNEVGSQIRIIP